MSSALVVGDRGSGLTTFVGLLYTAQVRLGTEEADEFRFHADRETIRQLEAIYGELGAGRFPERDVNWEEHPLSFVVGFRNGRLGGFSHPGAEEEGGFGTVRIQVGGISTQELAELREHDAILEESTRRLLRSQMVIPLVDAGRLLPGTDETPSSALARYDTMLAATLDLVGRFLSAERDRRARKMYPLFVVTKLDRCPAETLVQLDAPRDPAATWSPEVRQRFGQKVLERYLPETKQFLTESNRGARLVKEPPLWFFSHLRLTEGVGGPRIERRSRAPIGSWEPEYPFEEYRALIERLASLARRLPRPAEE
jgi:hypothetical protein